MDVGWFLLHAALASAIKFSLEVCTGQGPDERSVPRAYKRTTKRHSGNEVRLNAVRTGSDEQD